MAKIFSSTRHTVQRTNRECGQVMIVGIVMMVILLFCILFLFDLHNVIRAKFKMETAQESAALTAANWQKESLNLIGEINLLKITSILMEDDAEWTGTAALSEAETSEEKQEILARRFDLLTEMQTRISFVGPLIGFAAAQQAAKANGLTGVGNLNNYIERVQTNEAYDIESINGYRWKQPYIDLLTAANGGSTAAANIAVFPNVKGNATPEITPSELGVESLYSQIRLHAAEIAARNEDGTEKFGQSSWHGTIYHFVKNWTDSDFSGKWWDIDYSSAMFPKESEIYTLGLSYGGASGSYRETTYSDYREELRLLVDNLKLYEASELPVSIQLCRYNASWYPEYYRQTYSNYDDSHYQYWYEKVYLRKAVKSAYIYEGPAAYAEGMVEVGKVMNYRMRRLRSHTGGLRKVSEDDITTIGNRNISSGTDDTSRTGVIAKAFGSLSGDAPPIDIPIVLPVFDTVTVLPTYMPVPYGFRIMRLNNKTLQKFLSWLSGQSSLHSGTPDADLLPYLSALQTLIQGKEFRYYGYNPNFDAKAFDAQCVSSPGEVKKYDYYYDEDSNPKGAGWLQQAQLFPLSAMEKESNGVQTATDYQNGGEALRIYLSSSSYYVINSRGHVVTNDEGDPTVEYIAAGGGHSSCSGGDGFGGHEGPDTSPGPPRL